MTRRFEDSLGIVDPEWPGIVDPESLGIVDPA
jgi:hypothetical protein